MHKARISEWRKTNEAGPAKAEAAGIYENRSPESSTEKELQRSDRGSWENVPAYTKLQFKEQNSKRPGKELLESHHSKSSHRARRQSNSEESGWKYTVKYHGH